MEAKDLNEGDLLVWSNTNDSQSFYGSLIRLFTWSEYTHVGIVIKEENEWYVIEAVHPAIRKVKLSDRTPFFRVNMNLSDKFTNEHRKYLLSKVGAKYSIFQAILSLFGIYINDNFWYCTEQAYDFYVTKFNFINIKKKLLPTSFVRQVLTNGTGEMKLIKEIVV